MRRPRLAPLVFAIAAVLAATGDAKALYHGDLNLFVGQLWLTNGDWSPVDEQPEIGLKLNFGEERVPVHFAIDLFASRKTVSPTDPVADVIVKGATHEVAIGVRKVWDQNVTRPHLGAGATAISVSEERHGPFGVETNEDKAYGAWVDVGVSWRLAGHLNLGLDARYSYALARLGTGSSGRDVRAGGVHLGLLIGYGW